MNHLDWYHNHEEKRKERMKNNGIYLINQELKRMLQQLQSFINPQDYKVEAKKADFYLVQSSIWNVGYINNMENEKVAVEQALLILTILKREDTIKRREEIESNVQRQMRQLGNIDWGTYTEFLEKVRGL